MTTNRCPRNNYASNFLTGNLLLITLMYYGNTKNIFIQLSCPMKSYLDHPCSGVRIAAFKAHFSITSLQSRPGLKLHPHALRTDHPKVMCTCIAIRCRQILKIDEIPAIPDKNQS